MTAEKHMAMALSEEEICGNLSYEIFNLFSLTLCDVIEA